MESVRPLVQPQPQQAPYPSRSATEPFPSSSAVAPLSPPPSATQSSESLPPPPHVDFDPPTLDAVRRKSVDMGGLALALALNPAADEGWVEEGGAGWGWAGWEMGAGVAQGPL